MPTIDFTLLPLVVTILVVAAAGALSRSLTIAAGAGVLTIGWMQLHVDNSFLTGLWYIILVFMAFTLARHLSEMVLGDTA